MSARRNLPPPFGEKAYQRKVEIAIAEIQDMDDMIISDIADLNKNGETPLREAHCLVDPTDKLRMLSFIREVLVQMRHLLSDIRMHLAVGRISPPYFDFLI